MLFLNNRYEVCERHQLNHSNNQFDMNRNIFNDKNQSKTIPKKSKHKNRNNKSKRIPLNKQNNNPIDNKYILIYDSLLQMGFNKSEVINKLLLYNGTNKSSESVFNELINQFTNDTYLCTKKRLRSHDKSKTKSKMDCVNNEFDKSMNISNEYIQFEHSYDLLVDCHLCDKSFQCLFEYETHLKEHYKNSKKKWMECDFNKCENKNLKSSDKFIEHIW